MTVLSVALLSLTGTLAMSTSTSSIPGSARDLARSESSAMLQSVLEGAPSLEALIDSAERAARRLDSESTAAGAVEKALRDARWKAVVDRDGATRWLAGALEEVSIDLAFEPIREAELPVGFPEPTPVLEIELKTYPAYRMAKAEMGGRNNAFWQLFEHIQQNDIPMTAPVEMTFDERQDDLQGMEMAFLYESTEQGEAGPDGSVEVVDVEPLTVVSLGLRGRMRDDVLDRARALLLEWIGEREELEVSGPLRTMGYNSPMVPAARSYWEVQIPVKSESSQSRRIVIDFGSTDVAFYAVDDRVMGGVSRSGLERTDDGTAVFGGTMSRDNNGGFASVRSQPGSFGMDGKQGLVLAYRGDGKTYKLRLRTSGDWDGVSYQVDVPTEAGVWEERSFDFEEFVPTFRGRRVSAPELDPGSVATFGLLISDGQEGRFRLEVASISAY